MAMAVAVYMLGFNSYLGFAGLTGVNSDSTANEKYLNRIYAYAKGLIDS